MEVYDNNYRGPVYIERRTNGLGTAGFIISLIDIILILFLFAVIAAALGIAGASTALYTML